MPPSPADLLELALLVLLILGVVAAPRVESWARRLAQRPGLTMALVAAAPVVLRLGLLPNHPVPTPAVYDEFSHLLAADTLRHLRLANPPHALHRFFETIFVLQQPTYSSIYPPGQGLVLAMGRLIFGLPWAGVVLSTAAFCGLCCWMLRGWVSPGWALLGGMLAIIEFGPLSAWMNTYWGGAVPAAAGCLVFGALPRLQAQRRTRDAILLGSGLGIHLLARPFESVFVVLSVLFFLAPQARRMLRPAVIAALAASPAVLLILAQNKEVTGSWTALPYVLSRWQYGVPASFTLQPNPVPHRELTPQQELEYRLQCSYHGPGRDTVQKYMTRFIYRLRFCRFFLLAPLWIAALAFLPGLREARFVWLAVTLLLFFVGTNFYPMFLPHYVAAVTCLVILAAVAGLERLSRISTLAARLLVLLCAAHFVLWYE